MKTIAVLMSTYNGSAYLEKQIDSILNQNVQCDLRLIIRDDGSTDETVDILKVYQKEHKLVFYKNENLGAGYSFLQMVLDNPGYDFYAFSDQDDVWRTDKLKRAIDIIGESDTYELYCSNAEMCDADLKPLGRNVHKNMLHYNADRVFLGLASSQGCTCVFNDKLAKVIQNKPMPKNIVLHDSFIIGLCFAIGGHFTADEYVSMKYRMHSTNIGGLTTRSQFGIFPMIKKRLQYIFTKPSNSIINQNKTIINQYEDYIVDCQRELVKRIIESKHNVFIRIGFFFSPSLKDESINLDMSNRIKILLNNY